MKIKILLMLSNIGFPIIPIIKYYKPELLNRIKIIKSHNINVIFDVGANIGQYSMLTRAMKYKGEIISFEPLNDAFKKLKKNALNDKKWKVNNYALGSKEEKNMINISKNSFSSSFLNLKENHLKSAPKSLYIGQQEIEVKRLDTIYHQFCTINDNVLLKIDTQGFEKNVIDGAEKILSNVKILQLEMSIVELYEDETPFLKMIHFIQEKGFTLISLESGFANPTTGELLQVDGIFINRHIN